MTPIVEKYLGVSNQKRFENKAVIGLASQRFWNAGFMERRWLMERWFSPNWGNI